MIDKDGKPYGICSLEEALNISEQSGLDLVEISPDAEPPVCKVLDFGKYQYDKQKQTKTNKKKQHIVHVKEIRLRPNTGSHDLVTKLSKGQKFLEKGDKLKITMMFRGREFERKQDGLETLKQIIDALSDLAKVDKEPTTEGRRITVVLSPI